ncbi:hypothetical protein [Streptomyces pristinaespiralis]|uniref:hypothetical protein n=1 Tax=Streptomyces pristinaespiralis TaxID=38300 RepID=UPI00384A5BE5
MWPSSIAWTCNEVSGNDRFTRWTVTVGVYARFAVVRASRERCPVASKPNRSASRARIFPASMKGDTPTASWTLSS